MELYHCDTVNRYQTLCIFYKPPLNGRCPLDGGFTLLDFGLIQRIHLRCGSFGSIIHFLDFSEETNVCFQIINPDLDLEKCTLE